MLLIYNGRIMFMENYENLVSNLINVPCQNMLRKKMSQMLVTLLLQIKLSFLQMSASDYAP